MKRLSLSLVLMLLIAFFCMQASCFAEKPESISIGVMGDFSGPYAPVVGPTRPGTLDAWQYLNKEAGGIQGIKLEPILKDMGGKVDVGQSQYNELVSMKPKPIFIDMYITPLAAALRNRFVEDNVVSLVPGAGESLYPVGNSYAYYALYPEQIGVVLKWIKDNWKKKENPKFGIITWDTGYGRAIVTEEFYNWAEKIGVDIVDTQLFGIRDVDLTPQLMKLRAKNPDYLITNSTASGPLAIKKGLKEMGWDIKLINTSGGDWGTAALDPSLFEGDLVALHVKSFDEVDDPSIKTVMTYFTANNRTEKDKSLFYLVGWQVALLEHKILNQVVKDHGWKGLNAENVMKELNNLKDFAPLEGITKMSYSEKRRSPTVARVYKITKGKFLPVTDFVETPDLRPAKFK
ncbi:MAG: ABC transporter substrate-binding protein [Desulfomonilaceae bacterium]|nr:ABC transporter substrate-binding protein [Desulfomonilaceae bacterium]